MVSWMVSGWFLTVLGIEWIFELMQQIMTFIENPIIKGGNVSLWKLTHIRFSKESMVVTKKKMKVHWKKVMMLLPFVSCAIYVLCDSRSCSQWVASPYEIVPWLLKINVIGVAWWSAKCWANMEIYDPPAIWSSFISQAGSSIHGKLFPRHRQFNMAAISVTHLLNLVI